MGPALTNDLGVGVTASDGSLVRGTAAGFAMRPIQNVHWGAEGIIRGDQSIAKAELVGAWAQLQAGLGILKSGGGAPRVRRQPGYRKGTVPGGPANG